MRCANTGPKGWGIEGKCNTGRWLPAAGHDFASSIEIAAAAEDLIGLRITGMSGMLGIQI